MSGETGATPWRRGRTAALLVMAALLAVAFFSRFWNLAAKPFAHDEGLFAYYSYCVYPSWNYRYDPLLHGPLLEHLTGALFAIAGDSDFTVRFWPAFLGSLTIGLFWGFRRRIGAAGAVAAAAMACFSPTLLFYSRFLRNDTLLLFFALLFIASFDRWIRKGGAWSAFFIPFFAGVMICVKENVVFVLFTGATYLVWVFLVDLTAGALGRFGAEERRRLASPVLDPYENLLSLKVSIGTLFAWIALVLAARKLAPMLFPPPPFSLLSGVMGLAVLSSILLVRALVRSRYRRLGRDEHTRVFAERVSATWLALASGALMAMSLYIVLFTTLFRYQWGFFQIYRETLSYWWGQHALHRLRGPFHYYAPRLVVYETAPLLIVLAGAATVTMRRWRLAAAVVLGEAAIFFFVSIGLWLFPFDLTWMDQHFHMTHPWHVVFAFGLAWIAVCLSTRAILARQAFHGWLVWWTAFSFLEYSYAEKVPWLGVHIVGPLVLLAGSEIGRLAAWLRAPRELRWLRHSSAAAAAVAGMAIGFFVVRGAFVAYEVGFVSNVDAAEMLVYNHTLWDTAELVREIEDCAKRSGAGFDLDMTVESDCDATWPLIWHLRHFRRFSNPQPLATTADRIVIASEKGAAGAARDWIEYRRRAIGLRQAWVPEELDLGAMWACALEKARRGVRTNHVNNAKDEKEADEADGADAAETPKKVLDRGARDWRRAWRYFLKREPWFSPGETSVGVPVTFVYMRRREDIASRPVHAPVSRPTKSKLTPPVAKSQ